MHIAFSQVDHRPWPHPKSPWTLRQNWHDLLFAHWPIAASKIRHLIPRPLEIQEFDGTSWVAAVPFRMSGVMHRPLPDLPSISAFPELNLRLYVTYENKPGVWFVSLDAANSLAVWGARTFYHLPYFRADMELSERANGIQFRSRRRKPNVEFQAHYRPTSTPYRSTPGTLEHFLTERYCLYAQSRRGNLYRCEIQHVPWPLQRAEATILQNELGNPFGIPLPDQPTLLHFARRVDVVTWPPRRLRNAKT